jgi:hypothetical protein
MGTKTKKTFTFGGQTGANPNKRGGAKRKALGKSRGEKKVTVKVRVGG